MSDKQPLFREAKKLEVGEHEDHLADADSDGGQFPMMPGTGMMGQPGSLEYRVALLEYKLSVTSGQRIIYLPRIIRGSVVLVPGQQKGSWRATDQFLQSKEVRPDSVGIFHRASKNFDDRVGGRLKDTLLWGRTIYGVDDGA